MQIVEYSLNGKKFRDFGVYVSASDGLLDKPKPKTRKTYDWAEYHGKVVDTAKPRYDERSIELKCWALGDNWQEMKNNIDELFSEFDKEGLARLIVDFGKELVFDVYLDSEISIDKKFSKGQTHGEFTLKLKEPNPIKKVLKLTKTTLNLRLKAKSWVDIKFADQTRTLKGNINISEILGRGTHYITIAGNIDEITDLTTNAEIIF